MAVQLGFVSDPVRKPEDRFSRDMGHMSQVVRKTVFAYAKTKMQISFAVTAKLISTFVFSTLIVESLCFLNPKFQAYNHLLWLYSLVLCQNWSETPKTGFLTMRLICDYVVVQNNS